jgi:delta-aminolevulinic acid dehydratase/porphobilinogen synthase
MWVLHYRPEKVSQPWYVLGTFDTKVNAIIKAYQVSSEYFMIKVTDMDGRVIWST